MFNLAEACFAAEHHNVLLLPECSCWLGDIGIGNTVIGRGIGGVVIMGVGVGGDGIVRGGKDRGMEQLTAKRSQNPRKPSPRERISSSTRFKADSIRGIGDNGGLELDIVSVKGGTLGYCIRDEDIWGWAEKGEETY